jgi:glycosyltransferase involved in cell wall biosynthesis
MKKLAGSEGNRVRVLINGVHARSGGGLTYLRNILAHLANDERLELHLFLHHDQLPLFASIDERITTRVFDFNRAFWSFFWWEQVSLPLISRAMSADVTFSPANFGPLFAQTPVIMLRNAYAVGSDDPRFIRRLYWRAMALMTAASLMSCRRAIAVSRFARDNLSFGRQAWRDRKVHVVYHGVNPIFVPGEKTPGMEPCLLLVADIYIQKNLHTLIEALPIIHRSVPGIRLKVAGRRNDEFYYDRIVKLIARLDLQHDIEFLGHKRDDELLTLYRDCAVFVLPSTMETFGNPLAEAMACGAPVACSNVAAMPEIVGDGAILFDPLDAENMAEKIVQIVKDPAFAKNLATRGHARSGIFSWETTARRTADILVDAAQGRADN